MFNSDMTHAPTRAPSGALFVLALASCLGCGAPSVPPEDTVAASFPSLRARIFEAEDSFSEGASGFVITPRNIGGFRTVDVTMPNDAANAIVLRAQGDVVVNVREEGLRGAPRRVGNSLVYEREEGASFWSVAPVGVESWVYVPAGNQGETRLVWTVTTTGGELRPASEGAQDAAEVVDRHGIARLRVTAPEATTASGRVLVPRLIVGPQTIEVVVDTDGEAALVDPIWAATNPMVAARQGHTATLIATGQVLVVGGNGGGTTLNTTELYSPATNTWKGSGNLSTPRYLHTATVLASGKVLVAGGFGAAALSSAEVYDPALGTFSATGAMTKARYEHAAVLLGSGKVLVAGGVDAGGAVLPNAEVYDPVSGTWSAVASMAAPRARFAMAVSPQGMVLATGGRGTAGTSLSSAELHNPGANSWTSAGTMANGAREGHQLHFLPSGHAITVAGLNQFTVQNGQILATTDIYDPVAGTWSTGGNLAQFRYQSASTLLPNGKVLVAGGNAGAYTTKAEVYDDTTNTWSGALDMSVGRAAHTVTSLGDGRAIAAGGDGTGMATADLYSPVADGTPCTLHGECLSGYCVDGVCCDAACTGPCVSCLAAKKGAGNDGVCGGIKLGTDPDNECTDLGAAACSTNGSCDGVGQCDRYPAGTVCVGASCNANVLTLPSQCAAGSCVGAGTQDCAPFQCAAGACSSACVVDSDCDPSAYCNNSVCVGKGNPGAPCLSPNECLSTFCADGVCCDQACAGACDACSLSAGGPGDGKCVPLTGTPCDDGDACTQADTCQGGVCTPGTPLDCPLGVCDKSASCDPATGQCSATASPNGSPCDDGDPCTTSDTCISGVCSAGSPVVCMPAGECREAGVCDPTSGLCSDPVKLDGAPCSTAQGQDGTCVAGECVPEPGESSGGSTTGGGPGGAGQGGDANVGGNGASSTGAGEGASGPSGGSGANGADGEPGLRGGGCSLAGSDESNEKAFLLLTALGLWVARRRRTNSYDRA